MASLKYVKAEKLSLRLHPELNEKWVQELIANDPSLLGLGDVYLKDKERIHSKAGRLDILLQHETELKRYEVEIQLGKMDESHIIRAIEYWDIERKRYPQYEHCAVIVAEDVTSRFLNVISLFNGAIPLIAIQMSALKFEENITLSFTTVLNQLELGLPEEDEKVQPQVDRAYWESQLPVGSLKLVDEVIKIIQEFAPACELNYVKSYIGFKIDGHVNNFASFSPQKKSVLIHIKLLQQSEVDALLAASDLETLSYVYGGYRIRLTPSDVTKNCELLGKLLRLAYEGGT